MNNATAIIRAMNIRQRSDGRFEGRISYNNKRKSFYGSTKAEIKNKAKEYFMKIENGYKEPSKLTLSAYIEYWLTTYKLNKIEPTSYTRLCRVYNSHIKNTIGSKKIGELTTQDIQQLIDEYANPTNSNKKALALSGLKKIVQLLNPCLKRAIKDNIILSNPCEDVVIPTKSYIVTKTKQQYSLNDEEIKRFHKAALLKYKSGEYVSRNALSLLIILNLGLRAGEAIALEWDDINFEDNLIYINKTLQCGIKNTNSCGENAYISKIKEATKTTAGKRIIQMNDTVKFYLKELMSYDIQHNISSQYVCCNKFGKLNNHRNLQKCLDRICQEAKIDKRVTLHTLRHTFGSTLIRRGVGIEVISKLMGHANITITYNKYIHTIKEEEAKAMKMIAIC